MMKKARKSIGRALGRRYVKKYQKAGLKTMNYNQISRDIMMLKNVVNAEKKIFEQKYSTYSTAQVDVNNSGMSIVDITPLIAQGATQSTRNGASIKLHSALYQFQLQQHTAATLANKIIIEFWINKATQLDVVTARDYLFSPSTFNSIVEHTSSRNSDRFSEFRLIRRVIRTVPTDSISAEQTITTFDVPIKFNSGKGHHVRLNSSASSYSDILNGQMFMTMRPSVGNMSFTTPSTKDVPLTAANTGVFVRFAQKVWYYDN